MKVFYTASYYGKEKYQKYYDMVLRAIEKSGAEIVSPEKGNYLDLLTKEEQKKAKDEKERHYLAIKKGIEWADVVVIEVSQEDFQLGHEATLAIFNKKPVLCLSIHEDFSKKIKNKYFYGHKYGEMNVEEIVEEFLNKIKGRKLEVRFNCFLSGAQDDFLEKRTKIVGMNKSEYLRKLIDEDRNLGRN